MPATQLQTPRASKLKAPESPCDASQTRPEKRLARTRFDHSNACRSNLSFAGLVALARSPNPIPSRTRPLNSSAPMVLCLKTWESRSLPGLQNTDTPQQSQTHQSKSTTLKTVRTQKPTANYANWPSTKHPDAGWSSPVARQAHNLKVTGSNPVPATKSNTKKPMDLNDPLAFGVQVSIGVGTGPRIGVQSGPQ